MPNKSRISDLAIFGGHPAFADKLHVGRPNIGDRRAFADRMDDILDRRWLTNAGPFVQEFESRVAELAQVRHCIAMCNATIALEIAIRALELKGEVIVPSFTFVATAHALEWQGITPVFCDIDPRTHNIDPAKIEGLITERTTAIIGVHLWGRACNIEALARLAKRHSLRLLFDAAHAFGCSYSGEMVGGFGEAEVFSFHGTKFVNTFEGGAVVTNDDELAERVRLMKNFGFAGYDRVVYVGTNGKMSELSAAMGLTNLESLDKFVAINRENYRVYYQELSNLKGIKFTSYDEGERCNYQYISLEIDETQTGISRDELMEILWAENVLVRRYFYPGCHRMKPYADRPIGPLPETDRVARSILVLPNGTTVTLEDVRTICNLIKFALENGESVLSALRREKMTIGSPGASV